MGPSKVGDNRGREERVVTRGRHPRSGSKPLNTGCSLKKWLYLGLGQGKYSMSLKHLVVKSQEVCKTDQSMLMHIETRLEVFPLVKSGQFKHETK